MLVLLCAALWVSTESFGTKENLLNITKQTAVIAILAIAETYVIIAAGIDLAVGSVLALSGVSACLLMNRGVGVAPAVLAGVLREAGVGLELWASGRLTTPAERARAATLAGAGVSRWIVPTGAEPPEPIPGLTLVRRGPGGDLVPLEASP